MSDNDSMNGKAKDYTYGVVYEETIGCPVTKSVWYFAYGAMMNPTSLRLRSLKPQQSQMGCLKDYELHFRHPGGWADVQPCEGKEVYGVMHLVNVEEQKILDAIEGIYERKPLAIELADGRKVFGGVYIMKLSLVGVSEFKDDLPQERYLDILVEGAQHFGLPSHYIDWLKSHATVPRIPSSEFQSLPAPSVSAPTFTVQELEDMARNSKKLVCAVNGKVIRHITDDDNFMIQWALQHFHGKESIYFMASGLYEPLYQPFPCCYEEMNEEHKARCEDGFVRSFPKPANEMFEVIGRLDHGHVRSLNPFASKKIQEENKEGESTEVTEEGMEGSEKASEKVAEVAHAECDEEAKEVIHKLVASSSSLEDI